MGLETQDWSYSTALPSEALSVLRARRFVCRRLVEHRLFYLVDDVRLVVSELAANAVRHAETPFTVSMEKTGESVLLGVNDDSPSLPVHLARNLEDTAGRGLSIVDGMSRDWGVIETPTGKTVWASFRTRGPRPQPLDR